MFKKYSAKLRCQILNIFAGEYYVSSNDDVICTVLGSCISVCLYDKVNRIGGMNHFMLPGDKKKTDSDVAHEVIRNEDLNTKSLRYGITAMEVLIAEMIKKGAMRENLSAKIFGGGKVIRRTYNATSIGDTNIGFTKAFLKMEGIKVTSENVGEYHGRKIYFLSRQNRVYVKKVELEPAVMEERKYMKRLELLKDEETDITIF